MATWRDLINDSLNPGDSIEDLSLVPKTLDLDKDFDDGYGGPKGQPFVAYSEYWVYFCVQYDGAEWVSSVPRQPMQGYEPTHHGGG